MDYFTIAVPYSPSYIDPKTQDLIVCAIWIAFIIFLIAVCWKLNS